MALSNDQHRPSFFLLFTGFVLKGDKEGISAGLILYNLTAIVPLIGDKIQTLLIHPGKSLFILPYFHHILLLPVSFIILLNSVHNWKPNPADILKGLVVVIPMSIMFSIPVDINPSVSVNHVRGPWFFWGIQEMLRYLPPLLVGVVMPLAFFLVFSFLPWIPEKYERVARAFIYTGICFYGIPCVVFWLNW
ncbi:MAG: hypothetical protein DRG83_15115 [Deltaproteobacteria bacterium]|nr:MAG: hypothetical protein DRG83_15115 [Deltaproteobacteria bacterium]